MQKNLYIKTYGCQMNVYDSDRMVDLLAPLGYRPVSSPEGADMVILNTCHVREKPTEKMYSELGRLHPLKKAREASGKKMVIAVAGCTAQAEGAVIMKRAPYVDIVFGPQSYHLLPEMVARATRAASKDQDNVPGRGILEVDFPVESKFDTLPEVKKSSKASAFVTIQEGCDKFCHFCIVPYTRGAEYSRPVADVLKEVKAFVDQGVKEVTLLGQNVNAYHGASPKDSTKEWGLGRLIYAVAEIEGVERIRYTTSHPRDVDEELIAAHRDVKKLMPYLHLPVQSGSDAMLKAMNRKHTVALYDEIIEKFRKASPGMTFTSDFIVGYPGETDKDFEATMDLVRRITFSQAYSFKYSRRPGTPGAALETQVPEDVKDARLAELQGLLREQQLAFNESMIGRTLSVLFEKKGRHEGQLIGRSPYFQSVYATASDRLMGEICDVEITDATINSLTGRLALQEVET